MAMPLRKPMDPINETLRTNVEGPPKLEDEISVLIEKTSKIHAGFLFDSCGKEALQKLCQCLSATKLSPHYKGWRDFGVCLGLNQLQLECIHLHFNVQDPAWYTLQAFVQKEDSTMDKIISTLQQMERFDIIMNVIDLFTRLAEEVTKNQPKLTSNNDSRYFSITQSGRSDYVSRLESNKNAIIRPTFVPEVPFVLQEFRPSAKEVTNECRTFAGLGDRVIQNESCQRSDDSEMKETSKKAQYGKTVMLTFAADGLTVANEVAKIFRRKQDNEECIGVLILNDHISKVNANPEKFIFSAFEQVDYVMPIISEGYLQAISSSATFPNESSLLCVDPKYVKYIYTLMNTNYIRNGCINYKVRCLIPDAFSHLTYQHPLMSGPIFQAWAMQGETENLKQRMLKTNF